MPPRHARCRAATKPESCGVLPAVDLYPASLMSQLLRLCLVALSLAVLPLSLAHAQAAQPTETQERLDVQVQQLSEKLASTEKQVDLQRPTAAQLAQVASDVAPLATQAQALVDHLAPRVAAMKARLDEIGAKPEKGESAEITKQRAELEKAFQLNDGLSKSAKLLLVKAQQQSNYAAKRQRSLFTTSLFQRSTSILSPQLWFTVVRETPGNLADASRVFHAWLDAFNQNLTGGRLIAFWAIVLGIVILYWPLTVAARRVLARESHIEKPGRWRKVLVAWWTAISVSGLAIGIMYGVVYVFSFAVAPDPRLVPLFDAMQWGVIRTALAVGLSRALLAPGRRKWRMVSLDDEIVDKLVRSVIAVAMIVAASKIIEAVNNVIYASLEFSIAARGLCALLVAGALALALFALRDDPEAANSAAPAKHDALFGVARACLWALIVTVTVAVLVGFIPFASFLDEQLTLVVAVGSILFLLVRLVDESSSAGFQPSSRLGRNLIYTVGLRRETLEQLPVLISGFGRVALFVVAAIIVIAPWGMQSSDLAGNLGALFFGFKVGDVTISIAGIVVAIVTFLLVLAATRAIQNWLEDRYLPTTRLDSGLRNSIKTSLGYLGFIVAIAIAAANLGVDFQKLAIVAGALSVGIGFGLQSIVNNFVSGLILLWERAVRVGDWVVVGSDQGYVRKINVRSTEIETFDRAAVIVPNSNLVSGVVKNLMRTDKIGRITIELTVNPIADPEKVREVLLDITRDNEDVLSLPSPQVRFTSLTASAMTFDLFCYVSDVESALRTKSDLYFEICRQFRQHHFFDGPAPDPTAIRIVDLDKLEELLKAPRPAEIEPLRQRKAG